jgi:ABC-type Fe3+ transport system permease subunit/sugar lactone lactonase YvrE
MYAHWIAKTARSLAFTLWCAVIGAPLILLCGLALKSDTAIPETYHWTALLMQSAGWAALVALVAVLLGLGPATLLARTRRPIAFLGLLILPLVLPRYVLYYAWSLLLSPTTALGRVMAENTQLARVVGQALPLATLALWYWPLAALLMAQALRMLDCGLWDSARLDAKPLHRWVHVTVPLLWRPLLLAFGVCFLLVMSEFTTFHLSGMRTVGSELAVLYELTGSTGTVARAALPLAAAAVVGALALMQAAAGWESPAQGEAPIRASHRGLWCFAGILWCLSLACPVLLLLCHVRDAGPFVQFLNLHSDDLAWSLWVALCAGVVAWVLALAPEWVGRAGRFGGFLERLMVASLFLVLFIPASVLATGFLTLVSVVPGVQGLRMSWMIVALGQGARYAGLALIVRRLLRITERRDLAEVARLDGVTGLTKWWHVDLPCAWPALAAVFLLMMMFCLTELSATLVLLPPGLPSFAQRLLNQMHYARDEHVIASCLVLVSSCALITGLLLGLIRSVQGIRSILGLALCALVLTGCEPSSGDGPTVLDHFGRTGRGPGQFMYPRAIERLADGHMLVMDKTGRIQTFNSDHDSVRSFRMPRIEQGKPTGMSMGPDGHLYVADTHCHRVCVFALDGTLEHQFGQFGTDPGCFIYPTDVAFSGDGRIYVSEYGGNDRISVFNSEFQFLYAFGSPGSEQGQFSRPAAVCVDSERQILYVVDACNHRIALYDLDGTPRTYWGSMGLGPGQLRYPYDMVLMDNGDVLVCEFGNNRLQRFNAQGESLGTYGQAGRNLGQLAYPWGVTVDAHERAYVVDAGNNRIQIWKL